MTFRSWVTGNFLTSPQSSKPEFAGVRTAILGSLWTILLTILFSLPLGVGAAVYLEEYASKNWFNRLIETNINNLAGVPSIIYGMLGLAIFVRMLEPFTSGTLLGVSRPDHGQWADGDLRRLDAGPADPAADHHQCRVKQSALCPGSLRQASYGLGATKWQTIWHHVLPSALPGILTGTILAISRAIGETAPLVVIGRVHVHCRGPERAVLQVHDATHPDLPVDVASPSRIQKLGGGGDYRPVDHVAVAECHRRDST